MILLPPFPCLSLPCAVKGQQSEGRKSSYTEQKSAHVPPLGLLPARPSVAVQNVGEEPAVLFFSLVEFSYLPVLVLERT